MDFLKQLELIDKFNTSQKNAEIYIVMNYLIRCNYCNKELEQDKESVQL